MPPMASSLKASNRTKVECGTFSNNMGWRETKSTNNQKPSSDLSSQQKQVLTTFLLSMTSAYLYSPSAQCSSLTVLWFLFPQIDTWLALSGDSFLNTSSSSSQRPSPTLYVYCYQFYPVPTIYTITLLPSFGTHQDLKIFITLLLFSYSKANLMKELILLTIVSPIARQKYISQCSIHICWMDGWINEWLTECEAHNIFTDWMNAHHSYLGNILLDRIFENKQLPIWQYISCLFPYWVSILQHRYTKIKILK